MKRAIRIDHRGRSGLVPLPDAPEKLTVGSNPGCDVVLKDPGVDAVHLEIEGTTTGVRIRDLGTRQGTRLNGMLVSQALLAPGDEVRVGEAVIRLASADAEAVPAPAPVPAPPPAAPPAPKPAPVAPPAPKPSVKVARARGAREARKRSPLVYVVLGAVLLGGVLWLVLFSGETDEERGEAALRQALVTRGTGDREGARKELVALLEKYPAVPSASRAERALREIDAEFAREEEAFAGRKDLRDTWRTVTLPDFERDWEAFRKKYDGTPAARDEAFLPEVREEYRAEGVRRFGATRDRANALADARRWYDAMLVWHEYLSLPSNVPPNEAGATEEFRRLQARAASAWAELDAAARALIDGRKLEDACRLLEERREEFANTRHAFDLRSRLELAAILGREPEQGPAVAETVQREVDRREEFLRGADAAEGLVRDRRYADAVAAYEALAGRCPHPELSLEFRARAEDLGDYAALFTGLRDQVREHPERFKGVDLGNGFRANATGADAESLVVNVRGSEMKLPWSRLSAPRILELLVRMQFDAPGRLRLARFALEGGDEEVAHGAITAALKADDSLSDRAFALLARARRIPVPDDGFVLYRDRWMTPSERDAAALRDRIAEAEKAAGSTDRRRREEALAVLREIGEPARPALVRALSQIMKAAGEEFAKLPAVRDPATKAWLFAEIEKRRTAALALIFDEQKYPYPHPEGPEYEQVQAEVNRLVDEVRAVWSRPVALLIERSPEVKEAYDRVENAALELAHLGAKPEPSFEEVIAAVNDAVGIRRFAPGGPEKSALEWNDKVLEYNRLVAIDADAEERACVDALNEYRMMMGRRAVKWSDKLLEAARAHSREMKEAPYFAHDCPLPGPEHDPHRRPGDRTRQAGYGGGVSENIAMGSQTGVGAFSQWYGSSGHHRNMLGKGHTEVGVGRLVEYWTQNFGSQSKSVDVPRPPR